MALSPIFTTYIYTKVMFKKGYVSIGKNFSLYVLFMALVFYLAFAFSEKIIPIINKKLYNCSTRVMGITGLAEDVIIHLLIIIPLFLVVNFLFKIKFKGNIVRTVYLLLYYIANYLIWSLYFAMLANKVY